MAVSATQLIQALGIFKDELDAVYAAQFVAKDGQKF